MIDWQQAVSLAIVALAAGLLARSFLRRRSSARGVCGGGCHCPGAPGGLRVGQYSSILRSSHQEEQDNG